MICPASAHADEKIDSCAVMPMQHADHNMSPILLELFAQQWSRASGMLTVR